MAKLTLSDLANLQNETTAVTAINANSALIETAMEKTLSRDGTSPNTMSANLDMNSKHILNLPQPATADEPLRLVDLSDFTGGGTVTNIPAGGTAGESLIKASSTDFDVTWSSTAADITAGTNIVLTGTSPVSIATSLTPAFTRLSINTGAGVGYVDLGAQSSTPAVPASGQRLYSGTNNLHWISATDGFDRNLSATLTASRIYTLQDADYTVAGLEINNLFVNSQRITLSTNGGFGWTITNANAGISAVAAYTSANSVGQGVFGIGGTGYTAIPILQNRAYVDSTSSSAGIIVNNEGANPILFGVSNTEVGRWSGSTAGLLQVGLLNTTKGQLQIFGNTSGNVIQTVQAAAGTPTITWGTSTGTPVVTASSPLTLTAATGNLVITGAAGQVLAGSGPAFTATPTIAGQVTLSGGVSGTTPTPQLVFSDYFDNAGAVSISHLQLFVGFGFGIGSTALNYITLTGKSHDFFSTADLSNALFSIGETTHKTAKTVTPVANDGAALGTTALNFSDLFLAAGAVVNWNNGDVTLTHSTDALAFAGGTGGYSFTGPTTTTPTIVNNGRFKIAGLTGDTSALIQLTPFGGTDNFLFVNTSQQFVFQGGNLVPASNDGAALGTTALMFSDLFLASGAVLNFNNGNYTATHSAGLLTLSGSILVSSGSVTTTSGDIVATNGNFQTGTAAKTLLLKQGANGSVGTFVLNGATPVTVSNTNIAITDAIIISLNTVGGTVSPTAPNIRTITAGTGFTVAGVATDTSTYNYTLIKNAA